MLSGFLSSLCHPKVTGDFQSSCLAEIIPFSLFLNSDISGEKSILPVIHKDYQKAKKICTCNEVA